MDFEELMSQTGVKIIDKDINNKTISKKEKKKKKSNMELFFFIF